MLKLIAVNYTVILKGYSLWLKVPYCAPIWSFILGFDVLKNIYVQYKYQKTSQYIFTAVLSRICRIWNNVCVHMCKTTNWQFIILVIVYTSLWLIVAGGWMGRWVVLGIVTEGGDWVVRTSTQKRCISILGVRQAAWNTKCDDKYFYLPPLWSKYLPFFNIS